MRKLIGAGLLALGTLLSTTAMSAPALIQEPTPPALIGGGTSVSLAGNAIATGDAVMGTIFWVDNSSTGTTLSNVQVSGTNSTLNPIATDGPFGGLYTHIRTFYLLNVTGNPTTVTANFTVPPGSTEAQLTWREVSQIASFDAANQRADINVPTTPNAITTALLSPLAANDYLYVATVDYNTFSGNNPAGGPGFILGYSGAPAGGWTEATESLTANAGTSATGIFSYTSESASWLIGMAGFKPAPIPVAADCHTSGDPKNTATEPDNLAIHTTICTPSVTMSDGSGYSGTTTVTGVLFEISAGNLRNASGFTSTNDGTSVAHMAYTQNGVTYSNANGGAADVNVNIIPASQAGTPLALGWKGVDPSGQVVFTEPTTALNVKELVLRNSVLASGPAFLHAYKAPTGVPCTLANVGNLTSLTTGEFDLAGQLNNNQSQTMTTSLAVGDSVCVLTHDNNNMALSPTTVGSMQGTLTVTVN